jgi:two-component system chemotaxis response regulator CheY
LKKLTALVIDDNLPIRMLVRSLLLDLGFGSVDIAESAEDGWAIYLLHKPDLILLDWHMDGGMDGMEFTRRVRKQLGSPKPRVPILMMSGFADRKAVLAARDAGITEIMTKPFTVQTLIKHLTHIIENPRDFVVAPKFIGPDRRRRKDEVPEEKKKRTVDKKEKKKTTSVKKSPDYADLRGGKKEKS